MPIGQLVIVSQDISHAQYGMIVSVMSCPGTEDSYVVLVGTELLILSGADIAEI